jgi:hypothetical protein
MGISHPCGVYFPQLRRAPNQIDAAFEVCAELEITSFRIFVYTYVENCQGQDADNKNKSCPQLTVHNLPFFQD